MLQGGAEIRWEEVQEPNWGAEAANRSFRCSNVAAPFAVRMRAAVLKGTLAVRNMASRFSPRLVLDSKLGEVPGLRTVR